MAIERFANGGATTLSASITNTDVTCSVVATTNMPTTGNFRILIDAELILVTAVSGTTLTITRGIEGTTAASHASAAAVTHILTAGSLADYMAENNLVGTYANLPAAGRAGRVYRTTDSLYTFVDNGSTWDAFVNGQKVFLPPTSGWSWVNQGSAAISTTFGGLVLENSAPVSGNLHIRSRTAPSTPYTIDILHNPLEQYGNYWSMAFGFRKNSTGLMVTYRISPSNTWSSGYPGYALNSNKWSSTSAIASSYQAPSNQCSPLGYPHWVRMKDDGTNLSFYYSYDNILWAQIDTNRSRTDYIVGAPDEVLFGIQGNNGAVKVGMNLISWNAY